MFEEVRAALWHPATGRVIVLSQPTILVVPAVFYSPQGPILRQPVFLLRL
jgi:hypothetical protein